MRREVSHTIVILRRRKELLQIQLNSEVVARLLVKRFHAWRIRYCF